MALCETRDVPVHYEVDGEGPGLLMLNGLLASAFLWPRAWLERFRRRRTVVRVSNRGTGRTPTSDGFAVEDMVADALAVLDALGLERVDVLGYSMGGILAQVLALDHPERVRSLVLCSTTPGGAVGVRAEFFGVVADAVDGRHGDAQGAFFPLLVGEGFFERHPEVLGELAEAWLAAPTPPETIGAQLRASVGHDARERLAGVAVPTLVLHGREDRVLPVEGAPLIAGAVPGARLEVFEGVGHLLPFETSERTAALVEAFLEEVERAAT